MTISKQANWIAAELEHAETRLVYFRRVFDALPAQTVLRISADTRYKLYVNGTLVQIGPCKGEDKVWYVDTVELAPYLRPGRNVLAAELFPLAEVITPNLPELFVLDNIAGGSPECVDAYNVLEARVEAAQRVMSRLGAAVLAKGGHAMGRSDDVLVTRDGVEVFPGERIQTKNTHGTGCTLSTAIASNLAKGMDLSEAVRRAKAYVAGALAAGLDLGHGSGPLHHGFALQNEFTVAPNA